MLSSALFNVQKLTSNNGIDALVDTGKHGSQNSLINMTCKARLCDIVVLMVIINVHSLILGLKLFNLRTEVPIPNQMSHMLI